MPTAPVLFLIFNRPDTTQLVFEQIRQARPAQLFIAADGPRSTKSGEAILCAEARQVVQQVDWDCEVRTLFREQNLGCKQAVSSAIDWFFSQVDAGIILEDDCLPEQTFFSFCTDLLDQYRDNDRVMHISGITFQARRDVTAGASYYFSGFASIWGWATWRRAWQRYAVDPTDNANNVSLAAPYFNQRQRWLLGEVIAGRLDTWDVQWLVAIRRYNGLSIVPRVSQVTNIGFGLSATHTVRKPNWLADLITAPLEPLLIHPSTVAINTEADWYDATHIHRQSWYMRILEWGYFTVMGLVKR
jgi:hypothetical protein